MAAHRSVSDFVLESALARAGETLAGRRNFDLNPAQWKAFLAALDAPPRPLPRLERLLKETVPLRHPAAPEADVYGSGLPISFSSSIVGFDQPPPGIGEHNEEIYGTVLGSTRDELCGFRSAGVI